jgi:hypothetical protein
MCDPRRPPRGGPWPAAVASRNRVRGPGGLQILWAAQAGPVVAPGGSSRTFRRRRVPAGRILRRSCPTQARRMMCACIIHHWGGHPGPKMRRLLRRPRLTSATSANTLADASIRGIRVAQTGSRLRLAAIRGRISAGRPLRTGGLSRGGGSCGPGRPCRLLRAGPGTRAGPGAAPARRPGSPRRPPPRPRQPPAAGRTRRR